MLDAQKVKKQGCFPQSGVTFTWFNSKVPQIHHGGSGRTVYMSKEVSLDSCPPCGCHLSQRKYLSVLLWRSSFHFSQSLSQFYSSDQGAPRFPYLRVWEVKYVWSQGSVHNWYLSEMLSEVCFYRSWREFVKPCALTCCSYIVPVREWSQEPRLPCLSSRCPACYKCFSVTFCASFPPCPWGGDDKTCLIRASARIDETCVEPSWNSAWPLVSSQQV